MNARPELACRAELTVEINVFREISALFAGHVLLVGHGKINHLMAVAFKKLCKTKVIGFAASLDVVIFINQ